MNPRSSLLAAAALLAISIAPSRAITLPVKEDTFTLPGNVRLTTVNGAATALACSTSESAYVSFDLTKLPASVSARSLLRATLRVYVVSARAGTTGLQASAVDNAWHETTAGNYNANLIRDKTVTLADTVKGRTFATGDVTRAITYALFGDPLTGFQLTTIAGRAILGSKEGPSLGYPAELELEFDPNVNPNGTVTLAGAVGIGKAPSGSLDLVRVASGFAGDLLCNFSKNTTGTPTPVLQMKTFIDGGPFQFELFEGTAFKPGGGSFAAVSDARLKKDIEPLSGALEKLMQLRPVTFEYKEPEKVHQFSGTQIGLIAQEVEGVFPEWVSENAEGYKTVSVRGFEALSVQALRELRAEKDAEIEKLKAANAALAERLDRLEGKK